MACPEMVDSVHWRSVWLVRSEVSLVFSGVVTTLTRTAFSVSFEFADAAPVFHTILLGIN
jgi:hypothetical protein